MRPGRSGFSSRARGFSIVELLVSLTIGLIISAGALSALQTNRLTFRLIQNQQGMQETAYFAMYHINRILRMESYRGDSAAQWVLGPLTQSTDGVAIIQGTDNEATTGNIVKDGTDVIAVVFEGSADGFVKDCLGNTIAAGVQVTSMFAVSTSDELLCSIDGGTTYTPIVDGVENLQVQLGEDTDNDQIANRYVDIGAQSSVDDIVSVRYSMLIVSTDDNLTAQVDQNTYTLLGTTVYGTGSFAGDRRLRRIATTTVKLRNRL